MSTNAQPLQGDNGPISTACDIASAAITLNMCQNLGQSLASGTPMSPSSLANSGASLAVLGGIKLAQKLF